MSVSVTYKGSSIASFTNATKTLKTSGKYMEGDVTVSETNVVDLPVFTETWDSNWETLLSLTCDKTFAECRALCNEWNLGALLVTKAQGSSEEYISPLQNTSSGGSSNPLWYTAYSLFSPVIDIVYNPSGTITETSPSYFLGTLTVTENGTYYPENKAINEVIVNVPPSSPNLQAKINVSPTTSSQTITADSGYDGLSSVQINAMPSGTAGTPSATKGSVSNHTITVTPSVTNTTGYISGGTLTGTGVSVSASELVSGNLAITENDTTGIDVTNYETVTVNVPSSGGGGSAVVVTEEPDTGGGVVKNITAVDISNDTVDAAHLLTGYTAHDHTGTAITGGYVAPTARTSDDITVSGATVTVPAGAYASQATKAVASGTAGTPTAAKGTVSNHSVTVTPSVTNTEGYISGGTKTGTGVSVSASELVSGTYNVSSSGTVDVTNYASISVPSGTAGTPTATKGSVSNHSVSVTPSVTNTAGYISSGTKTGTAVTVSASELVSGSETKTANGTYDVTNLAQLVVNVSTGSSKNVQVNSNYYTRTANSYGATNLTLTVAKTGTYNISWMAWRSSSSGTMGTNLHIGSTTGTNQTTWLNTYGQHITLTNQSLTQGTVLTIYATSGSNSRTIGVGNLIIEEQ